MFGLAYAAARLLQGWLDAHVLKPAGISGGVRDSIRTGVGYVGIVIAALAAFAWPATDEIYNAFIIPDMMAKRRQVVERRRLGEVGRAAVRGHLQEVGGQGLIDGVRTAPWRVAGHADTSTVDEGRRYGRRCAPGKRRSGRHTSKTTILGGAWLRY